MSASADATARTRSLIFLLLAQVTAMTTWFATTASLAAMRQGWTLTPFQEGLMTSSVQAGFVAGTLTSALLSAADRYDPRNLFMTAAAIAGIACLLVVLFEPTDVTVPMLRFATGFCLAGVYPVGMKMAATWAKGDLGLLIGLLVGAVTLGSAMPHLFVPLGLDWRVPCIVAGVCALIGAVLIRWVDLGPNRAPAPPFRLANATEAFRRRPLRLANLGYFGHMWELYAMWAWIGTFLGASFALRYGASPPIGASIATFLVIASGAIGCLAGGWAADRVGRTAVTIASLAVSGTCALIMGFAYGGPAWLILLIGIIWGITVVSDSAQFSASVTELSDRTLVGTMLTVQTCIGFLLTLVTIHVMPYVVTGLGWTYAFMILAIGPAIGMWAMARLRADPASTSLAGGRR
ncbi:MFS transporter [Hyphomicrobium sp. CS1BSMeth3]|uniref:MFS transporter n=1 Tax=Hyphomicrobium sp. CS1BSMeth3 TaxID=1892844 RepID=UPI000930C70E|nr:MFS transporter [Hyphomicrobium sp. CS1BSMeth3]